MRITFEFLEAHKCFSVTDYCRLLVNENLEDYTGKTLEVYRGEMKCLIVNDIYKAAELYPDGEEFVKWRPSWRSGSRVRLNKKDRE